MSRASHVAAFAAGAVIATAFAARAVPRDVARYKTLDAFAQALVTVQTSYVDQVDEKRLLYDAARGMLHNLDQYSTFLPPNRYKHLRQDTEGEFGGVGLTLAPGEVDDARPNMPPYPTIDGIVPRSPAEVAGLQLDDRITSIEGAPTAEAGRETANAGAWEARMRGASGTRVMLTALRAGWKEPRAFTLIRAQVKQPTVRQRVLEKGIGYLAITRFAEATTQDASAALVQLRAAHALDVLVLDLRNDPGGLVDQAISTADLFLESGTIVTIRGRAGSVENQTAHKGGVATSVPIIILVDQGTASAAEILAAALRDHGRAKLVGTPTYGKGTVQTFFDLEDGAGLKLTTARYYTPKGNSLESKGLVPDVRVDGFTPEEITAGSRVGGNGGSGTTPGSGATIADDDDDPQLTAAVKLARQALRGGSK
ncbi:MAG: S41 family peptidase [Deltaproteobacteria bacterium]|nr:S41 family peptidase [Deltaproteobacteria bacterium]MDQ3299013.1 S41 family peptidase [Myxococcota bacterium]